jgi:hypothetical protein
MREDYYEDEEDDLAYMEDLLMQLRNWHWKRSRPLWRRNEAWTEKKEEEKEKDVK